MADFLSRLIDRSRGAAPVARPVVAPRFAAAPPEDVAEAMTPPAPLVPDTASARSVEPRSDRAGAFDRPRDSSNAERRAVHATTRLARVTPSDTGGTGRGGSDADNPPTPRSTVAVSLASTSSPPFTAPPRPTTASRRADGDSASRAPRRDDQPATPSALRPRTAVAHDWERQSAPASAAAPVIRVTIGRIEVKAAPPSPAPMTRPPAGRQVSAVTLEEYLRPRETRR